MYKKLTALLLGTLTVGALQSNAQEAPAMSGNAPASAPATPAAPVTPAAPTWSTTITPSYVNVYMFRGSRLGGQSFEPSITSTYGNLTLGVWANDPIVNAGKVPGQSDPEIDPNASYTIPINDSLNIQPGATWYTYLRAPTNQGYYKMTFEPKVAVNWTAGGFTLSPTYYYDMVLQQSTAELNAAYSIPLKSYGTAFNINGTLGTYLGSSEVNGSNPQTHAWGNYYLIGFSMPYQVCKQGSLSIGWAFTAGSNADIKVFGQPQYHNPETAGRGVVTVSFAWTF